jgi:hypothetical protein
MGQANIVVANVTPKTLDHEEHYDVPDGRLR